VLLLQWTQPNSNHQKLKSLDPTRPNPGQPNPWTTLDYRTAPLSMTFSDPEDQISALSPQRRSHQPHRRATIPRVTANLRSSRNLSRRRCHRRLFMAERNLICSEYRIAPLSVTCSHPEGQISALSPQRRSHLTPRRATFPWTCVDPG